MDAIKSNKRRKKATIFKYTEKTAVYNFYCLLHSKKKMYEIIKKNKIESEIFIVLRPDLIYLNKLDLNEIKDCVLKRNVLIPSWESNGGYNDKIAIVYKDNIEKYLNAINYTRFLSDIKIDVNSESYLKLVLTKLNVKVKEFSLVGKRMRSNKVIIDEELDQLFFVKNFIYLVIVNEGSLDKMKGKIFENDDRDMYVGQIPFELMINILEDSERKYKYYVFLDENDIERDEVGKIDIEQIESKILEDNITICCNNNKKYVSIDGKNNPPCMNINYNITYLKYNVIGDYLE